MGMLCETFLFKSALSNAAAAFEPTMPWLDGETSASRTRVFRHRSLHGKVKWLKNRNT